MIVDDSQWKVGENHVTIIDYHALFGQQFDARWCMIVDDS